MRTGGKALKGSSRRTDSSQLPSMKRPAHIVSCWEKALAEAGDQGIWSESDAEQQAELILG